MASVLTPSQSPKPASKSKKSSTVTVEQIQEDRLTQLANEFWTDAALKEGKPFNPQIVEDVYQKELMGTDFSTKRIMMLEFSRYMENYLWSHFNEKASVSHILSIVVIVNEKFRERVPAWEVFKQAPDQFGTLFSRTLHLLLEQGGVTLKEQTILLIFLNHCFNSLEVDLIRGQVQELVALPIWSNLLPGRREDLFKKNPKYRKFYTVMLKKDAKLPEKERQQTHFQRQFLANLFATYLEVLHSIPEKGKLPAAKIRYCERFLELMIDIEAQLLTRRCVNELMDDKHIVVHSKLSKLYARPEGKLFTQLLEMLEMYAQFEIDEKTGEALTVHDRIDLHYDRVTALQRVVFCDHEDLQKFALANVASIDTRESLTKHFSPLSS